VHFTNTFWLDLQCFVSYESRRGKPRERLRNSSAQIPGLTSMLNRPPCGLWKMDVVLKLLPPGVPVNVTVHRSEDRISGPCVRSPPYRIVTYVPSVRTRVVGANECMFCAKNRHVGRCEEIVGANWASPEVVGRCSRACKSCFKIIDGLVALGSCSV